MSKAAGLSTTPCEMTGAFGDFKKCHILRSTIQYGPPDHPSAAASSYQLSSSQRTLHSERDVLQYLHELNNLQDEPYVCIIAFESHTLASNGLLPLPLSRVLFEQVVRELNISPAYLSVLSTGMATYVSPSAKNDGTEWEHSQFVIQQNVSYSCYSMALTFNIKTGRTCMLIFGAQPWSLSELFARLGSMSFLPFGPMFVPAVAMELQTKWFNETVNSCHSRIYDIETATGMRRFDNKPNDHQAEVQDWKSIDLIDITRDLNSLLSRVAFLKLQSETGLYLIQQMQISVNSLQARLAKGQDQFKVETQDDIISKLEHIQSWYLGIMARLRYLTGRMEAQVQTVYCLVASRDRLTTIEIAQASRDLAEKSRADNITMQTIAELSRRDNKLMLQIAEDSRAVALATARDSAAMRAIAAVTILFLPATFTSTFFSMTFFNFLDGDKPEASPWIWIYVIATVLLTIVIQTTWAIISKRKEKSITQKLLYDQGAMKMTVS